MIYFEAKVDIFDSDNVCKQLFEDALTNILMPKFLTILLGNQWFLYCKSIAIVLHLKFLFKQTKKFNLLDIFSNSSLKMVTFQNENL